MNNLLKASKKTLQRFWKKVDKTSSKKGCWLWVSSKRSNGYGQFCYRRKPKKAHRLLYAMLEGKIPKNKTLDHLCRVRHCVNPGHLEVVMCRENILRGEGLAAIHAQKTQCKRGHPFTIENTYQNGKNGRGCRVCRREHVRQWRMNHSKYYEERKQYTKEYNRQWRINNPNYEKQRYHQKKKLEASIS